MLEGGRRGWGRGVASRGGTLVPEGGRHATIPSRAGGEAAVRAFSVVCRAGGNRDLARGRFVEIGGERLHVIEAGPKDRAPLGTVVILHGASGSAAEPFLALGRRLAEHYRVLAIDRPGHGWSDRIAGKAAASPIRQAALIAEALRRRT